MTYYIPQIMQESINVLSNILDNVDELAILNILNAKLTNFVSVKGTLFKQYSNSPTRTLSYYGINFMNSGSNKDLCVSLINECLLSFVTEEYNKKVKVFKDNYFTEQSYLRTGKNAQKEIEEELSKIRAINLEVSEATYMGLYREAEQINKIGFGSLFVKIPELGDFLEAANSGDKGKKEFYAKMKNIYEGEFAPSIIAGDTKRETFNKIPVQILLYTDFENLFNPKIKDYYLTSLKTGMARRSFIYIPKEKKKLEKPKRAEEKEQGFYLASQMQKQYQELFNMIPYNTVYQLSEEAKEKLYNYQCSCIDYFNNSNDNIIIKLEHKESFWKITKLAVVYSIIDNPLATIVNSKYVDMAIDFYNAIAPSLKTIIEKRKPSEIELFAEYMAQHADEVISRSDLRNSNIVTGNKFKRFFDEHEEEIKEEVTNTYGYNVYDYNNGKANSKCYQLMKV